MYNWHEIVVDCRGKWTQYLLRKNSTPVPKLVYEYVLAGRRNVGWQGNDGETNTHKGGKSLQLNPYTLLVRMMIYFVPVFSLYC
jgi:hypothetical protein